MNKLNYIFNVRLTTLMVAIALLAFSCGKDPGEEIDPLAISFEPSSGYHGEIVTIHGVNFEGSRNLTSVSIGGKSQVTILSMTSTEIVVSVPYGASTGPIRVSYYDSDGTQISHTSETDFVIDSDASRFTGGIRNGGVAFSINGKGYMGTGFTNASKKDFWEMDPTTMVWTQKADVPGNERSQAFGFAINGKGYIGGGENNGPDDVVDFYEYNPATNQWTQKASLTSEISSAVEFVLNGKGYIATGYDDYLDASNRLLEYDPTNNVWTEKAAFPGAARMLSSGFSINNKGYIVTGFDEYFVSTSDDMDTMKDLWEYDPSNNTWTKKADFPGHGRVGSVGFTLDGKGYIANGFLGEHGAYTTAAHTNEVWAYNPTTNTWLQADDFGAAPRSFSFAFTIGNKAYIGGGNDYFSYYDDVRVYQ